MDTRVRYDDKKYLQQQLDIIRYKYGKKKFDVITCSDDNAYNFLRQYGDEIFPGVPIVFSGTGFGCL